MSGNYVKEKKNVGEYTSEMTVPRENRRVSIEGWRQETSVDTDDKSTLCR